MDGHLREPLQGIDDVAAKFARLGEGKRRRETEHRARKEIADRLGRSLRLRLRRNHERCEPRQWSLLLLDVFPRHLDQEPPVGSTSLTSVGLAVRNCSARPNVVRDE